MAFPYFWIKVDRCGLFSLLRIGRSFIPVIGINFENEFKKLVIVLEHELICTWSSLDLGR
jgi:hypothetical protein